MARVLLVEDDDVQRKALEAMLKSADYQVLLAGNGAQALLVAQDKKPDIILTDLGMPKMDGKALCSAIRANPALAGIYIVVITAIEGEIPRLESVLVGADDFIRKPVQREELVHRIGLGIATRMLRRELAEAKGKSGQFTQAQDLLAAGLDAALRGIEEGIARLDSGDAGEAANRLRAAHESVRQSLAKIVLPEA
jgi:DNA-binding response OmpR family regulator